MTPSWNTDKTDTADTTDESSPFLKMGIKKSVGGIGGVGLVGVPTVCD